MSKAKHRYAGQRPHALGAHEIVDRIQRNGITLEDLKANFKLGYEKGKNDGLEWAYDAAYGSIMLALHREFGFGRDRLTRLAMATAQIQLDCMTNDDAFRALLAEADIDLPRMRDVIDHGGI